MRGRTLARLGHIIVYLVIRASKTSLGRVIKVLARSAYQTKLIID